MPEQHTQTSNAWRPQAGDSITGKIERISAHDAGWGVYPILELQTDDGDTVCVHAFRDVLKAELTQLAPKLGDRVSIQYQGKHPEKNYHRYRVSGGDGSVDWSKFSGAMPIDDDAPPF